MITCRDDSPLFQVTIQNLEDEGLRESMTVYKIVFCRVYREATRCTVEQSCIEHKNRCPEMWGGGIVEDSRKEW